MPIGVVGLNASLTRRLRGGRAGESQLREPSVAVKFLAKRAGAAHPHVGGSATANCAALGMPPMGERASTYSAVDRNKEASNRGAAWNSSR